MEIIWLDGFVPVIQAAIFSGVEQTNNKPISGGFLKIWKWRYPQNWWFIVENPI